MPLGARTPPGSDRPERTPSPGGDRVTIPPHPMRVAYRRSFGRGILGSSFTGSSLVIVDRPPNSYRRQGSRKENSL
ncbi:unnamed protein product [Lota lota]